jgi:hypothetical protein
MAQGLDAIAAYRDRLKAQGRMLEARTAEQCLAIIRREARTSKPARQIGAGRANATPIATTPR